MPGNKVQNMGRTNACSRSDGDYIWFEVERVCPFYAHTSSDEERSGWSADFFVCYFGRDTGSGIPGYSENDGIVLWKFCIWIHPWT